MSIKYGDPIMSLRMPADQIAGLKIAAERDGIPVSGIIRELVYRYLKENGITGKIKQLEGQTTIEDQ